MNLGFVYFRLLGFDEIKILVLFFFGIRCIYYKYWIVCGFMFYLNGYISISFVKI